MAIFHVAEKFVSINGEGKKAGELAVFIRFAGCNLVCNYCDTAWAIGKDAPYEEFTEEELLDYIIETGVKNVTLTGGEPLIQKDILVLLKTLSAYKDGYLSIEIETNGSVDIMPFVTEVPNISMTLDYKCPGSGMCKAMNLDNLKNVRANDVYKFVVSDIADLDDMKRLIEEYDLTNKCKVT